SQARPASRGGAPAALYHRAAMADGAGDAAGPHDPPLVRRPAFVLLAVAAVVAGAFLFFMFAATGGHFVPQVADLYLVCQYARAITEGHPFRYNPEEPPSTPATSLQLTLAPAMPAALGIA